LHIPEIAKIAAAASTANIVSPADRAAAGKTLALSAAAQLHARTIEQIQFLLACEQERGAPS